MAKKSMYLPLIVALIGAGLSPLASAQAVNPQEQVDTLEALAGKQPTFRRAQAKGVCASGYFVGEAAGRALSSASVFGGNKIPVIARFSVGGGNPKSIDKAKTVRGMALQFSLPNNEQWMMANISTPMYFISKAEQFTPFLQARLADPATGKPDPAKIKAFSDANPETTGQAAYLAAGQIPMSFATIPYFGVNTFEFTNAKGESQFARWQFVASEPNAVLSPEQLAALPDNFLFEELRKRVAAAPVQFDFKVQFPEKGDPLVDATKVWPAERKSVSAGKLTIDKVEAEAGGACDKMTFNPLVLPAGIKPSADPVLLARPAAYAVSLGRRLSESAKP